MTGLELAIVLSVILPDRTDGDVDGLGCFESIRCACQRPRSRSRIPSKFACSCNGFCGISSISFPNVIGVPCGVCKSPSSFVMRFVSSIVGLSVSRTGSSVVGGGFGNDILIVGVCVCGGGCDLVRRSCR